MPGRDWSTKCNPSGRVIPRPSASPLLVLFDVDGTILDGGGLIADSMIGAFRAAGETPPTRSDVMRLIGLSLREMIDILTRGLDPDRRDKIQAGYRTRYFDTIVRQIDPPVFPGTEAMLFDLYRAGITLGITTGKSIRSVGHLLDSMDWHRMFASVQCAELNPSKPSPEMVLKAMEEAGHGPRTTVLVGDSRYDMQMAARAGIPAVGVSWGYNAPEELRAEGAAAIAETVGDLTEGFLRQVVAEAVRVPAGLTPDER